MATLSFTNMDTPASSPAKEDVVYCRGSLVNKHYGNVKLCTLVRERAVEYSTSNYVDAKETIIRQMIEELTEDGGRFLQESTDGRWETSDRDETVGRIQAIFDEYTSTIGTDSSGRSAPSVRMSSPCSPPDRQFDRRLPSKTITPPGLSPRSIPLRRRDTLPSQHRGFALSPGAQSLSVPTVSPQGASMHRDRASLEIARMVFLQKQNERRIMLLDAMRQQENPLMGAAMRPVPPPVMRATSLGKRRQIDPLAPHRKRKTPRSQGSFTGR